MSASPSTSASLTAFLAGGTDNASYLPGSTYDTVPMADQTGRIAVLVGKPAAFSRRLVLGPIPGNHLFGSGCRNAAS